jgi:hypothetical protein
MAPKISWVRVNEIYYNTNCHFKTMIQVPQLTAMYGFIRKISIDHCRGGIGQQFSKENQWE